MVDFSNRKEAERWFKGQPREVCIAMAVRMALRVFPLCAPYILVNPSSRSDVFILPILRALAPPFVAGIWPTRGGEVRSAAFAAVPVARAAVLDAAKAAPVRAEADAAAAAAAFAAVASKAAATTTRAAAAEAAARVDGFATAANAFAAFADPADVFAAAATAKAAAATADAADAAAIEAGVTAAALCRVPLWPDTIPDKIAEDWSRLSDLLLDLDPNWSVWTEWYDDRLRGTDNPRSRPLIEELEVERALIPDEDWGKGAAHVNALIVEIEAKYRAKVPEQKPASAQFEWQDDGKLHVLPAPPPEARSAAQEERLRQAWAAQEEHLSALEQVLRTGNFRALDPVLASYRKALGTGYEDLNVIALGVHGARVESFASRADNLLMEAPASELVSFAGSHGMFVRQFDVWHDWQADSEGAPKTEEVVAIAQTARQIAAESGFVDAEAADALEEAAQSVELVTVDDDAKAEIQPANAALRNARRVVGNALSKFLGPILERVKKGSLDGLEEGCKRFVSSAIYRGLGVGLPIFAAHHFGWISSVIRYIEPALKAAGLF